MPDGNATCTWRHGADTTAVDASATVKCPAANKESIMPTVHFLQPASGAAERMICLHSSAASPRQWDPYRQRLGRRFELLTPELIGYAGPTGWPSGKPASLDDEARQLAPLLQREGAHLLGHSYGAAVALQIALRWPDRVRSLTLYEPVRFALLTHAPALSESADWITGVGRRIGMRVLSGARHAAAAMFVDYWSGEDSWPLLSASQRNALAERMPKVQAEFEALFADRVPPAAYRELRMPVTLLGGSRSPLPVRQVLDLLEPQFPNCRRVHFDGLGHMGPMQDPQRVLAEVETSVESPSWPDAA
jgi:pimeloyl-ACP methyl ester carboxylesterase